MFQELTNHIVLYYFGAASELQPRSRPARMLLWSWWMLSVVVAAAFSGTLTAVLSVSRQPQIFSSLEDLVVKQHGYKWGTFRDASIYILLRVSSVLFLYIILGSAGKPICRWAFFLIFFQVCACACA